MMLEAAQGMGQSWGVPVNFPQGGPPWLSHQRTDGTSGAASRTVEEWLP